jgi:Fe2+ transport system protein B
MDYEKVKEQIFSNICPVCGNSELLVKEISMIGSNGIILCESCESVFERQDRTNNVWKLTESNQSEQTISLTQKQWKSISESKETLPEVDTDQFESPDSSSNIMLIAVGTVAVILDMFIIFSAPFSIGSWVLAFIIALFAFFIVDFLQPSEPDLPVDNQSQNNKQERENKYCPDCGFENPASNNYCNDCGVKLQ